MDIKKVLTVRKQTIMCLSALSVASFIAFSNPLICKAEELDNEVEVEQVENTDNVADMEEPESEETVSDMEEPESEETVSETEEPESEETVSETEEPESEETVSENNLNTGMLVDSELQEQVADINTRLTEVVTLQNYITGILIFFAVVILCKYTYKFFNMFF